MLSRLRILVSRPDYFDVKYVINPWMEGNVSRPSIALAKKQWEDYEDILLKYAELEYIQQQPDVPDLVFTANAGLICNNRVIISRFFHSERQKEEPLYTKWFEDAGYDVVQLPERCYFEGAGDALFDRRQKCLWAGYGPRSVKEAYDLVAKHVDVPIHILKLIDPKFYHLDTCFCPLQDGKLIYNPKAFDLASQAKIAEIIPESDRYAVSESDAVNFACNAVDLEGAVLFHKISDDLASQIRKWGFEPIQTSLTEFIKAGGSAKCLSLNLAG